MCGGQLISRCTAGSVSCDRRDAAGQRIDAPNPMIEGIRNQEASIRMQRNRQRSVQTGGDRQAAISQIPRHARTGDGFDRGRVNRRWRYKQVGLRANRSQIQNIRGRRWFGDTLNTKKEHEIEYCGSENEPFHLHSSDFLFR
ncbi:MAG: hypothetical protein C4527_03445 [Candidatus Omnitrophota bacterium]|nr:MAG: hypothetical protein C4527_03445 [Candidatus Omnitrophota bacterium]